MILTNLVGGYLMRRTALAAFFLFAATAASAGTNDAKKAQAAAPPVPAKPVCANPNALGVARTVEIDTTGGPGFGFEQYKAYDFLEDKEVILTFDDGPQVNTTKAILDALQNHCTKATFFSIGKMALGMPDILRDVIKRGHTVGTHTMTHASIRKKKDAKEAIDEIEKGLSAVKRAAGTPIAPFFPLPVPAGQSAVARVSRVAKHRCVLDGRGQLRLQVPQCRTDGQGHHGQVGQEG